MVQRLENQQQVMELEALAPQVGERLRVEAQPGRGRYSATLVGYIPGRCVIVTPLRGHPPLNEGARVTVRFMAGNRVCAFTTRLIKIQTTPVACWYLEYPRQVEARRIRSHTRVPVELMVSVDAQEPARMRQFDLPRAALCADIGLGGAGIQSAAGIGAQGDEIFITARIEVAGIDQVLLLPGVIRTIQPADKAGAGVNLYGVEFMELEEELQLSLAAFVYQQYLIETGYLADEA